MTAIDQRRRWTMRARGADGTSRVVSIEARDGIVYGSIDGPGLALDPQHVSKMREILAEAQAVALQQRGQW